MAVAGMAAAAIGLGVSAAARADTPTPTPTPTSSATPGQGQSNGQGNGQQGNGWGKEARRGTGRLGGLVRGALGGQAVSDLATKLGVDETQLRDALKAVRDGIRADRQAAKDGSGATGFAKPDRGAMQDELATKLATKLGISADKVKAALSELQSAARAQREKAFSDRLDQAVRDGTLTQAEADAVKKAAKAGVIGMGARPGRA